MSGAQRRYRPLDERLRLYEAAMSLREEGNSSSAIGRKLGVSRHQVQYWLRGAKPKRVGRYAPDLAPSKELAYVSGFYLGDGKYAGAEHKVRFELAERDQLEHVGSLVAKILGRSPKPLKRDGTFYTVDYDSVALSTFLDQDVETMVNYLRAYASFFLQGFFDAEGYVSAIIHFRDKKIMGAVVGVANTRPEYLNLVGNLLSGFGIRGNLILTNKQGSKMTVRGRTWTRKHDVYHLRFHNSLYVRKFDKSVGFRNAIKAERLRDLVGLLSMAPRERYVWFTAHYQRIGRKWVKTAK